MDDPHAWASRIARPTEWNQRRRLGVIFAVATLIVAFSAVVGAVVWRNPRLLVAAATFLPLWGMLQWVSGPTLDVVPNPTPAERSAVRCVGAVACLTFGWMSLRYCLVESFDAWHGFDPPVLVVLGAVEIGLAARFVRRYGAVAPRSVDG